MLAEQSCNGYEATRSAKRGSKHAGQEHIEAVGHLRQDAPQILRVDLLDKHVYQSRCRRAQTPALAAEPGIATQTERVAARHGTWAE